MNISDFAIPILGFTLVVLSAISLKEGITRKKIIEIAVCLLIMGFSIWASIDNSETINDIGKSNSLLQTKLDDLLEKRRVDSNNNVVFQKYLKDTFGIERRGDKPVKIYFTQTKNYFSTSQENKNISDSINFIIKKSGDILYISPKEGTWVHAYFAFDTTNSSHFSSMLDEGVGTPSIVDKITLNNKTLNTHIIRITDRPVYKEEPIKLNMSGYQNGYLIFGEQGDTKKRYFYKQGKVIWIPQ